MMTRRAVPTVLALLALLGLGRAVSNRAAGPEPLRSRVEPARIELRRPRGDVLLRRDAGGPWIVRGEDDLADAAAVERLLAGLRALTFGPPVSDATGGLASGLGPADSVRVNVLDAADGSLFAGSFGRRVFARSAYFRPYDDEPVRLAGGLDVDLLQRTSSQWREPRLLPLGCPEGLEARVGTNWRPVPAGTVRALCSLRAVRWAGGLADERTPGFSRPLLRVRTPDGRGYEVGDRRGDERLARADGRSALFLVSAVEVERALIDLIGSKP